MPVKKDIIEYYKEVDFSIWEKSVNVCFDKLNKLKTDKAKTPWALKMYTNYLQLIEIFCINVWIISEGELYKNLFIGNADLRKKTEDTFLNKKTRNAQGMDFLTYFLESWVFGIQEKNAINNLDQKRRTYESLLREALEDYLKDYDLLNAYKHGFRTKSRGANSVSIKREGGDNPPFLIGNYNTKIIYLSKKNKAVYECSLAFNWERVSQKYFFLLNMLENTQRVLLAENGKIKLDTLYPLDNKEFNKYYGAFRVNVPLSKI
ncbi:MAG: hypothetical protein K9M51_01440 [Candidatus Gracilibacteria bacterium]|nr:hypothetical protein [Candidatus Gracilibacteria bacterium]